MSVRGNISKGSSGAPKGGAGSRANLAKKINTKFKANSSQRLNTQSSSTDETNGSAEDQNQQNLKVIDQENSALAKYQNENPELAFMKEENFQTELSEDNPLQEKSTTEMNMFLSSGESLASRVAAATGRFGLDSGFGAGRSRLPGDSGPIGSPGEGSVGEARRLPKFALTNSRLIRGVVADSIVTENHAIADGSTYTVRRSSSSTVDRNLSGEANNEGPNFEGFAENYLKLNADSLYDKFQRDERFRQQYVNGVEELFNSLDVRTLGQAPIEERRARLVGRANHAGATDKLTVANSFMTLLAKRGDLVDKVANSGLTVFVADSIVADGERVAGYFSTDNHMVLSRNSGFASFNATAAHELTHVLDHIDGSLDGHLQGLSPNWSSIREETESLLAANGGVMSGLDSGFLNYSLTNDMEFLAVMSQLYQSDTSDLQRNLPKVFSALDSMFRVS